MIASPKKKNAHKKTSNKATALKLQSLLNPNDPRWDIQIGIPRKHLLELLVTGRINHEAERLTAKGGDA